MNAVIKIVILYCILWGCIWFTSFYLSKYYFPWNQYIQNILMIIAIALMYFFLNDVIKSEKEEAVEKYKEEIK